MKRFLLALQFLTGFPIRLKEEPTAQDIGRSLAWYPAAGAIIGGLAGVSSYCAYLLTQERLIGACVAAVMFVVLSRGLHMDGLADSADAFFSNKTKEQMLAIMKDPHIGTMGVLGIACVLLLKVSLFSACDPARVIRAAMLAGLVSRYAMVFLMFSFPYARAEGTAKVHVQSINTSIFVRASLLAVLGAGIIFSWQGILLCIIAVAGAYGIGNYSMRRIAGITGDVIGALNELIEVCTLLGIILAGIGEKIW